MASGLRIVDPRDQEALLRLAGRLGSPRIARWFWPDDMRQDPVLSFLLLFASTRNMVVDLADGAGVVVFEQIVPGWRAIVHAAVWDARASRKSDLHRTCLAAAMDVHGLLVLDTVVAEDNRAGRMLMARLGFEFIDYLSRPLCYDGKDMAGLWYQISRRDLPHE